MTDVVADPQSFPVIRATVFDPPARLGELREQQPLSRLRFADGHIGWLVTNHTMARELLTDQRLSVKARRPVIARPGEDKPEGSPPLPGRVTSMDPPEHTRFRRLLTGYFSARRIEQLQPRIAQIVEEHLDAMLHAGPPADLVQSFARPIPSQVICEILGVPYADRARFQRNFATAQSLNATREQAIAAGHSIVGFMAELVARKRVEPDGAVISELIATGELTDEEIAGASFDLLNAGHGNAAHMLAFGTLALLSNPDQLAALRADPSLITGAVEELLRYLPVVQFVVVRRARDDIDLHGQRIKAGESVCISLPAANRDPTRFTDADTLDVHRVARGHLTFGHGIHRCIGQQLARVELRLGYGALLRRIPTLRLAIEPQDVPMRDHELSYGVCELPITW